MGLDEGRNVGVVEGRGEGARVGFAEGDCEGFMVGRAEGRGKVGAMEGILDGI